MGFNYRILQITMYYIIMFSIIIEITEIHYVIVILVKINY
jgi:hypothetical protein